VLELLDEFCTALPRALPLPPSSECLAKQ